MRLATLLNELRLEVEELTVNELQAKLEANEPLLLIDVREKDELVQQGKIVKALAISKGVLECQIEDVAPTGDETIVLYCRSGNRSLIAGASLKQMGYEEVYSLKGGFTAWKLSNYPIEPLASA
jgi:rhodanese-related sulfurtransferase